MEEISKKIEAILFYSGEPVGLAFLSKVLGVKKEGVIEGVKVLGIRLQDSGLRLLESGEEYSLVTAPEHSELIEKLIKEEREKDLGRAGIETLTIIAYKGPISKKEIEYIRGVNSQYALRNLLLRGLVERKASQADERMIEYSVTADTLRFLGLTKVSDLPEYEESRRAVETVVSELKEENTVED